MKKLIKFVTPLILLCFVSACNSNKKASNNGNNQQETPITIQDKENSISLSVSDKVYDGQPMNVQASATSGGEITLKFKASNAEDSELSRSAPKDVGSYTVKATTPAVNGYKAAEASANFTISQKEVELEWTAPTNLTYDGEAKVATAGVKASSIVEGDAVAVQYSLTPGCDNVNVGSFTFTVTSINNSNYKLPADLVSPTYTIGKAVPSYDVPSNLSATYGQTLADVALPNGFSWQDPLTTSVGNAGNQQFLVSYSNNNANYNSVHDIPVTIAVGKANPTYQIPTGLTATFGQRLADVVLPQGFTWVENISTPVGNAGERHHNAIYTPSDADNYNVIQNIDLTIQVSKAVPTFNIPEQINAYYSQTLDQLVSLLPEGFSFMEQLNEKVGDAGEQEHKLKYTPGDLENFEVVSDIPYTILVSKATPEITTVNLQPIVYQPGLTTADVTLPEGFAFANQTLTFDHIGHYSVVLAYTPTDLVNYNPVTITTDLEVTIATPTYTVPDDLEATFGDTLADIILPAGFSWEDPLTTSVGDPTDARNFSATYSNGNSNYRTVYNIQIPVKVNKADNVINDISVVTKTYDGQEIDLPSIDLLENSTVTFFYKLEGAEDSTYTTNRPVNAGNYVVKAVVSSTDRHNEVIGYSTATINQGVGQISFVDGFKTEYTYGTDTVSVDGQYTYNGTGEVVASYLSISDGSNLNNPNTGTYTVGLPTEPGQYYLKLSAAATDNFSACSTNAVININDASKPAHVITVENMAELTATFVPNGDFRYPSITIDGANGYSNYTLYSKLHSNTEWRTEPFRYAGTYDMRIVVKADASHRLTIYEDTFTIPKGQMNTSNIYWYMNNVNQSLVGTYGDSIQDVLDLYQTSNPGLPYLRPNNGGRVYFDDPLDTVFNAGTHYLSVRYVPNPIIYNGVSYDCYEEVTKTDYRFSIQKANAVVPQSISDIVIRPGVRLSQVSLPAGWSWQSPTYTPSNSMAGKTISLKVCYAGDDNHYANTAGISVTFQVGKLDRMVLVESQFMNDQDEIVIPNVGDGFGVSNIYHSEDEVEYDEYAVCILDENSKNADAGYSVVYKPFDAADSEYTPVQPVANGKYTMKITLFETDALQEITVTQTIVLEQATVSHVYEDKLNNKTYVFYATQGNAGGTCFVYNFVDKSVEELSFLSVGEKTEWRRSSTLSTYTGKDIIVSIDENGDYLLFYVENAELIQFTLPNYDYEAAISTYDSGTDSDLVETCYRLYNFKGLGFEKDHIVIAFVPNQPVVYSDLGGYDITGWDCLMEESFLWSETDHYIALSANPIFTYPYYQADENDQLWEAVGDLVDYGVNESNDTLMVYSFDEDLYVAYLPGTASEDFLRQHAMESYFSCTYSQTDNVYTCFDGHDTYWFRFDQHQYVEVEPEENLYEDPWGGYFRVYICPDGSYQVEDMDIVESISYDEETHILTVVYNYGTYKMILDDSTQTMTYYLGEKIAEYDLNYNGDDGYKAYIYQDGEATYIKIMYYDSTSGTWKMEDFIDVIYDQDTNSYINAWDSSRVYSFNDYVLYVAW